MNLSVEFRRCLPEPSCSSIQMAVSMASSRGPADAVVRRNSTDALLVFLEAPLLQLRPRLDEICLELTDLTPLITHDRSSVPSYPDLYVSASVHRCPNHRRQRGNPLTLHVLRMPFERASMDIPVSSNRPAMLQS
jgi:hypothetical protein